MEKEIQDLLERGVAAIERLAEDPVIEMETGPPVCPFCERINPKVRVDESSATGALGEFVIQAHCLSCNEVFYGIPVMWECAKTPNDASRMISERAELVNGNNG